MTNWKNRARKVAKRAREAEQAEQVPVQPVRQPKRRHWGHRRTPKGQAPEHNPDGR